MRVGTWCVFLLGVVSAARATTVLVTGGYATRTRTGGFDTVQFVFSGDDFLLTGGSPASRFGPCGYNSDCTPGAPLISDAFSTEDRGLSGQLTWNGSTITWGAGPGQPDGVGFDFLMHGLFPAVAAPMPPSVSFTVPFAMRGGLFLFRGQILELSVMGAGTATINTALNPLVPPSQAGYVLQSIRYDLLPIPEPGTALLSLLGLAGLLLIRKWNDGPGADRQMALGGAVLQDEIAGGARLRTRPDRVQRADR